MVFNICIQTPQWVGVRSYSLLYWSPAICSSLSLSPPPSAWGAEPSSVASFSCIPSDLLFDLVYNDQKEPFHWTLGFWRTIYIWIVKSCRRKMDTGIKMKWKCIYWQMTHQEIPVVVSNPCTFSNIDHSNWFKSQIDCALIHLHSNFYLLGLGLLICIFFLLRWINLP